MLRIRVDPYEFASVAALVALVVLVFLSIPDWLKVVLWAIAVSGAMMAVRGLWRGR